MIRTQTVVNVVTDLGITTIEQGDELWGQCPQHKERTGKEDRNPSWSINKETGAHFCFSCGYKGSLHNLVRDLRGDDAVKQLAADIQTGNRTGEVDTKSNRHRSTDWLNKHRVIRETSAVQDSDLYTYTLPPQDALDSRGIASHAAVTYKVLWDKEDESWILPFYTPGNGLIGWQRKARDGRFFHNEPTSMAKSSTLFGYHAVMAALMIVVVESPLDAVRLYTLGYPAMAIAGSRTSKTQEQLLSGFDRVVFALDNDTAGINESKRLYRTMPNALFAEYPSKSYKDPGDMPTFLIRKMFGRYFV